MDGLILLQLEDIVKPGIVDWNRVNRPPYPRIGAMMKKIENCNYAVENGRAMKYSLIGVAGNDIHDQNKTLTLSLTAIVISLTGFIRAEFILIKSFSAFSFPFFLFLFCKSRIM